MELFKSRPRVAYTNAVGDKVYPVVVDIKKGIKSTEDIQFVSSDVNTGILSVAFIQGNDNYNVTGADVVCSVMRPDASTLELPCEVVGENIVEVPLGINGTSQDGVYSFDFKVLKGENKVVGTPIMNYSVSLSISNDMVVEEDDRLPVLTMLMTQVSELHDRTDEAVVKANTATEATKVATANAIEVTNKANETVAKVTQDTANAIAEVNATADTMVENVNDAISSMDTTVNDKISEMTDAVNNKISEVDTAKNDMINDVSSTKANMVTEVTNAKNEMTATVTNKVNEVEGRFNALTASQQQSSEVIDARDGEVSLKARLDRDIEKANKELDKIKKLEESTVSTVETESDFTTVEATSNGYFEDVKLEGKTLVNHLLNSENTVSSSSATNKNYVGLQVGKTYTAVVYVIENNNNKPFHPFRITYSDNVQVNIPQSVYPKGSVITHKFELADKQVKAIWVNWCATYESGDIITTKTLLLEGDHTQNPPSYFEGLKSVGQDVDEISVESVKGDGNLFDGTLEIGSISADGKLLEWSPFVRTDYINVKPGVSVFCKVLEYDGITPNIPYTQRLCEYDINKNFIKSTADNKNVVVLSDKTKYIRYSEKVENDDANRVDLSKVNKLLVCYASSETDYTPHKQDKKRLLYYNNETQTWEKPILRQWDSIEKHANGKYYYHQRSGEVVLNGSENWGLGTNLTNTLGFNVSCVGVKQDGELISTTLKRGSYYQDNENIHFATNNGIFIRILKSKLSTQDVAGFKQWLQENNVTVVYQLAQEKVYECTNIDLITYEGETNYIVECGAIVPRTTLKVHNNISNVVSLLQKKVSLLESNVKASQEVQDMMILETDMRMLDIELALMEFAPMKLNLGGSDMLRSATYFNFLKNHIVNETYEKEYLENVMNKYLATGRINQDEYDELYKMLYPPVYDSELPIEP